MGEGQRSPWGLCVRGCSLTPTNPHLHGRPEASGTRQLRPEQWRGAVTQHAGAEVSVHPEHVCSPGCLSSCRNDNPVRWGLCAAGALECGAKLSRASVWAPAATAVKVKGGRPPSQPQGSHAGSQDPVGGWCHSVPTLGAIVGHPGLQKERQGEGTAGPGCWTVDEDLQGANPRFPRRWPPRPHPSVASHPCLAWRTAAQQKC